MIKTDICVMGAGAGGLSVAVFAAQAGFSVTLIEQGKMGGDCLNYGCVPSKALLAASHVANIIANAKKFGIDCQASQVNYEKVCQHIKQVQDHLAPNDSQQRMSQLGIQVIKGQGHFINAKTIQVDHKKIQAKYIVIATGSTASIANIPGIEQINYLTNESIFTLKSKPRHLIVIGGGPIGTEISQAHAMLGTQVSQLVVGNLLPHDNPVMVDVIRESFLKHDMNLKEQIENIIAVENSNQGIRISYKAQGQTYSITGSHLLLATGRKANINNLGLDKAGIDYHDQGIMVDKRLRTNIKGIYAIGDVIGGYQFTHMANYQAGIVIRNMLFKWPAKVSYRAIPWVTYTYPELAHVGQLSLQDIEDDDPKYRKLYYSFDDNDRAHTGYETTGKIAVLTNHRGQILACDIVNIHAGELLLPWILAIEQKLPIKSLVNIIAPYPTLSEITKRIAASYYTPLLFSKKSKWLLKWLNRFF